MIGAAIERAYQESSAVGTQEVLADRLGIDQTTVSKWVRGKTMASVAWIAAVESVCGLPRGQVLVWAGFVDPEATAWTAPVVELLPLERRRPQGIAASNAKPARPKGRRSTRPANPPEPEGP